MKEPEEEKIRIPLWAHELVVQRIGNETRFFWKSADGRVFVNFYLEVKE